MILKCTGVAFVVAQLNCVAVDAPPAAVCPPVRSWSKAFQQRVAAEVKAAPDSALAAVAVEAIQMRDVARACARARK